MLVAGVCLMQGAWILAVPAFRAIDEFDHAFRAASVGAGHWSPATEAAEAGRGRLVIAPRELVEAAKDMCESYDYTGPDNCNPVREVGQGYVTVASAATDQPSAVYAVAGYPSRVADGAASLYVMRVAAALLCAAMLALAVWSLTRWARGPWPIMTLLAAATPVAVYSTIIPSGNGLEMMSGIALWSTWLGLAATRDVDVQRLLLLASAPALAFLCGLRQLGPVMAVGIFLVVVVVLGLARLWSIVRTHPFAVSWLGLVAIVATAGQAAWVVAASAHPVGPTEPWGGAAESASETPPLTYFFVWMAQSFAAFPTRSEPAPTLVYVVLVAGAGLLWVYAMKHARRRMRSALVLVLLLSALLPTVVAFAYWDPGKWQGRYGLALAAGVFLVAGLVLDGASRPSRTAVMLWIGVVGAMHVVSVVGISRFTELPLGPIPPALLMVGGWALAGASVTKLYPAASPPALHEAAAR